MARFLFVWSVCIVTFCSSLNVWAGGSGYNVVIVVNQNSTNSVQLGNYYRQLRNIPPQNVLRINWPLGSNVQWAVTDFNNTLLNPLLAMLASRQLTNQIDYVVLSMDIPYRVNDGTNDNSTTSALYYGYMSDARNLNTCPLANGSTSLYAGSEGIFRSTPPISASSNSWLVTMITGYTLADAEMMVSQGSISDSTFPTQTVWLGKSGDYDRNTRFTEFDSTIFDTRLRGNYSVQRTNTEDPNIPGLILGYQNGTYFFTVNPSTLFVPGAMADNLTSFGGQIFESSGQGTLLRFVAAGVSGSFGTVIEPCAYTSKFPNPENYFYQSRGFSLAECYYLSLTNPYQGLVVGEPLAAPFALPATGAWSGLVSNAVLTGTTNLSVQFTESDAKHPVQQLDLFVDGKWIQTVTNVAPQPGNVLSVTLNGFSTSYTVPAGATIKSITTNLVAVLDGATYEGHTKVWATTHGDRIELHSLAGFATTGSQVTVAVSNSTPSGPLTTFIHTSDVKPANFLDTVAAGYKQFELTGVLSLNNVLNLTITKTNNSMVTVSVTNTIAGNTIGNFIVQLLTTISNTASLQGLDGITAPGVQTNGNGSIALFDLQANSVGYAAAQIKCVMSASAGLSISTNSGSTLTDNTNDLQPRNHFYITAGVSNLALTFPFNTANLADGFHELEAVAYEGSHVHTQARATQTVIIRNTSLSAAFTPVLSGTNSSLQPTLNFTLTPNTTNIATIQLFSTGGLLAAVTNQSSAIFSINYTNLGIGVHPFYAIVTDKSGHQYQTPTQSIGLIGVAFSGSTLFGVDMPVALQFSGPPPVLVWPATAGRAYSVQASIDPKQPFSTEAIVTPTNSLGQFTETNALPAKQYYRISVLP